MNKIFRNYAICWGIFFALWNVIAFVTPGVMGAEKFTGGFWIGYLFILISFAGQLACAWVALSRQKLTQLFYNIPLISISYVGLTLMLIVGSLTMAIPGLPNWVGVVVCATVLAFTAVSVLKAGAAAEAVHEIDQRVKAQTIFIRSLTVDAEGLVSRAQSEEIKTECRKVYEAVRYSDPMSSDALAGVESQITLRFADLSNAVLAADADAVKSAAREVVLLVEERNKKCKLMR